LAYLAFKYDIRDDIRTSDAHTDTLTEERVRLVGVVVGGATKVSRTSIGVRRVSPQAVGIHGGIGGLGF
jgi:hypothetical protein